MFDRRPHPDKNELHLLPVDVLSSADYPKLPSNINRYLARVPHIDVVCNKTSAFTYAKMCKLIVIGFIQMPNPREWQGTRVAIKRGTIRPQRYILPKKFGDYMIEQARLMTRLNARMSAKQRAKVIEAFRVNAERVAKSEATRALQADKLMFGQSAFDEGDEPDKQS